MRTSSTTSPIKYEKKEADGQKNKKEVRESTYFSYTQLRGENR